GAQSRIVTHFHLPFGPHTQLTMTDPITRQRPLAQTQFDATRRRFVGPAARQRLVGTGASVCAAPAPSARAIRSAGLSEIFLTSVSAGPIAPMSRPPTVTLSACGMLVRSVN